MVILQNQVGDADIILDNTDIKINHIKLTGNVNSMKERKKKRKIRKKMREGKEGRVPQVLSSGRSH